MSGRLTILPKKTYCPWKPENIERVLRDERLERERIEKESVANTRHKQQQRLQHREGRDANSNEESNNNEKGHINLFPEAKEAELRLTHTSSLSNQQQHTTNNGKVDESGVEPIPLGGNESINRKIGNVPFYMRSSTTAVSSTTTTSNKINGNSSNNGEEKYINTNNSFRLGTKRSTNNYPNNTNNNTDAITNKLMQDQYIQREDYRKRNMDPMNRFYADSSARGSVGRMEGVYANGSGNGITGKSGLVDNNRGDASFKPRDNNDTRQSLHEDTTKDKKHKKKKKRKKRSYSTDNSTSSSSVERDRHKKKRRKHKSKKRKHSTSHHHRDWHEKSRNNKTELDELRRRRHARESNERERLNNSRGDASSSFDASTIQTKDTRCYDGNNGFH